MEGEKIVTDRKRPKKKKKNWEKAWGRLQHRKTNADKKKGKSYCKGPSPPTGRCRQEGNQVEREGLKKLVLGRTSPRGGKRDWGDESGNVPKKLGGETGGAQLKQCTC